MSNYKPAKIIPDGVVCPLTSPVFAQSHCLTHILRLFVSTKHETPPPILAQLTLANHTIDASQANQFVSHTYSRHGISTHQPRNLKHCVYPGLLLTVQPLRAAQFCLQTTVLPARRCYGECGHEHFASSPSSWQPV